jgi:adenosine/AMP kinase
MELLSVKLQPPEDSQLILAQSHFIKTVEDVHECMVNSVPNIKFGISFCEASGPCLIRHQGNDDALEKLATEYAHKIGAGHGLVIIIRNAYPINILTRLREVPELVNIYCATANPIEVIIAETEQGRAILGVVDGYAPKGIEDQKDVENRKNFLRKIGYKM